MFLLEEEVTEEKKEVADGKKAVEKGSTVKLEEFN